MEKRLVKQEEGSKKEFGARRMQFEENLARKYSGKRSQIVRLHLAFYGKSSLGGLACVYLCAFNV